MGLTRFSRSSITSFEALSSTPNLELTVCSSWRFQNQGRADDQTQNLSQTELKVGWHYTVNVVSLSQHITHLCRYHHPGRDSSTSRPYSGHALVGPKIPDLSNLRRTPGYLLALVELTQFCGPVRSMFCHSTRSQLDQRMAVPITLSTLR